MRLFNFLRRAQINPDPVPVPIAALAGEGADMFSIEDTARLHELFDTPREHRDAQWKSAFFAACWNASIFLSDPVYFNGPDGLPYYRMNLPQPGMRFAAQCLAGMAQTCLDRNAGVAFFRTADDSIESSQWVISMGEIDSLSRFGSAQGDPIDLAEAGEMSAGVEVERISAGHEKLTVRQEHQILVGSPSADFLPSYTARAIHQLMHQVWAVEDPRVALVVDHDLRPSRNLVIGRKRDDFATEQEGTFEMQRISWMLPPGRGLMLMPDEWSERQMTLLADLF